MSTITNQRQNIFSEINSAIKSLFSSNIDIEAEEDIELSKELENELKGALKNLSVNEKTVEQPINVEKSASKKRGFGEKVNPIKDANTEKAMRKMLEKDRKNKDGMEIGD